MVAAPRTLSHRVPPEAKGARLDQHLATAFPELSRSRIRALLDDARVQVDGRAPKPAARLKGGEEISISLPAPVSATAAPEDLPLRILYEDQDLVVLDKAAGMVVHPAAGNWSGTLVNALLHKVKDLTGVGGELRPGIVHRLDKDTSGCLVVAKNERALQRLQAAFKGREVEKTYLALVHAVPPADATICTLFGRHPVHRKRFTGRVQQGKPAVTHFRVREAFDGAALLEVTLETGRTHQIRVHLSEAGHPLLGDALYGGRRKGAPPRVQAAAKALGRQGLHAWKLAFAHPRTGEALAFEAPLPDDFARALEQLRG